MDKLSYRRHRFPSIVIQQAVWLYFRFALSYRDVEDMLAERGIDVSYERVRRWDLKYGAMPLEISSRSDRVKARWPPQNIREGPTRRSGSLARQRFACCISKSMGLILRIGSHPAPLHIADNRLAALVDVDVFDRNFLLPFARCRFNASSNAACVRESLFA